MLDAGLKYSQINCELKSRHPRITKPVGVVYGDSYHKMVCVSSAKQHKQQALIGAIPEVL